MSSSDEIPPGWAQDLIRSVKQGFATQHDQLMSFGERLVRLEIRQKATEEQVAEHEGRLLRNSSHVKSVSHNDLGQDAAISSIKTTQEELVKQVTTLHDSQLKQTAMLMTLTSAARKFFSHPMVVAIAAAAGSALLATLKGCSQ